jgi:predicted transcriptional regulator
MTTPLAIMLTDEQLSRLELIAEAREETLATTVQEAVTAFLHKDAEYRAYVQEGLDDIAAGRVHDWEDVKAEMRAKYGVPGS